MSSHVALVPLGELLTQDMSFIERPEPRQYPKLSVKLYGKGVLLDAPVDGTDLKMPRHQLARPGQVILSEIWGKKGAIGLVPPEGDGALCTSHFFLFNINCDRILRDWLRFIFISNYLEPQLDREAKGTTGYAAVRPAHLLAAVVPLPPLEEQRRIVARIEEVAAKIHDAIRCRAEGAELTRVLAESTLDARYKALATLHGLTPLSSVTDIITDGDHFTPMFADEGVKFIFVGNVSSGRLHFRGATHVSHDYYKSLAQHRRPRSGDVLFSAVGATLGVAAVVDTTESFCFQRHIALIRPNHAVLDARFAWHMLRSGILHRLAWASTTGSAQPTVPLRAIRTFPLPLPSLAEQQRVAEELDVQLNRIGGMVQSQTDVANQLNALVPSILDKAFKGEL